MNPPRRVDVLPAEREKLAEAEACEDHHRDRRLERVRRRVENGRDLPFGEHALFASLLLRPLVTGEVRDRVRRNQAAALRLPQDPAERRHGPLDRPLRVPLALLPLRPLHVGDEARDVVRRDARELAVPEAGKKMPVERVAVGVDRPGTPLDRPDPLLGEGAERYPVGSDPLAAGELRDLVRADRLRLLECVGDGLEDEPTVAVTEGNLVSPARALVDAGRLRLRAALSCGGHLSARAEWFEFEPEFTPWLATNHRPEIWGTDIGIWSRLRLVPFAVTIPEADRDRDLPEKLREELPGILAWAVRGCLDWQGRTQGRA